MKSCPGTAPEDAIEVQDEGRLAGSIWPQQGNSLTFVHVQVDTEESLVAIRIGIGQT